jgi:hypothetical protein
MKRLPLVILLLAFLFPLLSTTVHATHDTKNKWKKTQVTVLDYTPDAIAPHVQAAAAKIGPATKGKVNFVYQRVSTKPCDSLKMDKGAVIICADNTKVTKIAAETRLAYDKKKPSTIVGAKVWYYGDGDELFRDWALLHEFGHAIGLNHSKDSTTSIMHPIATDKNEFLSHDLEAINKMYGPKPVKKKSSKKR